MLPQRRHWLSKQTVSSQSALQSTAHVSRHAGYVAEPGTQPRLVRLVQSGAYDSPSGQAGSEPSPTAVPHGAHVEPVVTPESQKKQGPNVGFATALPRSAY
eukprot:5758369-Pleurochrysis_carterae.AAC.1